MFICEDCQKLYDPCHGFMTAYGPCEECGNARVCLDARQYTYSGPHWRYEQKTTGETFTQRNRANMDPRYWKETQVPSELEMLRATVDMQALRIAELEWQLYGNAGRGKPDLTPPASPPGAQPARNTPHPHDR